MGETKASVGGVPKYTEVQRAHILGMISRISLWSVGKCNNINDHKKAWETSQQAQHIYIMLYERYDLQPVVYAYKYAYYIIHQLVHLCFYNYMFALHIPHAYSVIIIIIFIIKGFYAASCIQTLARRRQAVWTLASMLHCQLLLPVHIY